MGNTINVTLYGCNYDLTEQRPNISTEPFTVLTGLVSTVIPCYDAVNDINPDFDLKEFINDYKLGSVKNYYGYTLKKEAQKFIQSTKKTLLGMLPELNIIENYKYHWLYTASMGIDFVTTNIGQAVTITDYSLSRTNEFFNLEMTFIKRKAGL